MGGPIVRSGASPEFSKNWENIFGKRKPITLTEEPSKPPVAKTKKTAAKKKAKKN